MTILRTDMNLYLLKDIVDSAIQNNDELVMIVNSKQRNKSWQKNHNLVIRNYEQMKLSRQRIIKQRDKLQQQVNYYKKREKEAQPILDCKREVQNLLQSLEHRNGEISKLKQENQRLKSIINYNKALHEELMSTARRFTKTHTLKEDNESW